MLFNNGEFKINTTAIIIIINTTAKHAINIIAILFMISLPLLG